MKRRFAAILISLALALSLASPAGHLSVRAEEEQNTTPEEDRTPEEDVTPKKEDTTPEEDTDTEEDKSPEEDTIPEEDTTPEEKVIPEKEDTEDSSKENTDTDEEETTETGVTHVWELPVTVWNLDDLWTGTYEDSIEEYLDESYVNAFSLTAPSSRAGDNLTGYRKTIYDTVQPEFLKAATGERSSTRFECHLSDQEWEQMDADSIADPAAFTASIYNVFYAIVYDDSPYSYWWDNVYFLDYDNDSHTVYLYYVVAAQYQNHDESYWTTVGNAQYCCGIDTEGTAMQTAQKAMQNANLIAHEADGMEPYEALQYFHDRICSLNVYDREAAALLGNQSAITDHSAWHIINVFDMDPATNVLCEGYSKAFKYLFEEWMKVEENRKAMGEDAFCLTVVGQTIATGTGTAITGGHMWNLLVTKYGKYLIDATNDDKGAAAYPYSLFLKAPDTFYSLDSGSYSGRTWRYICNLDSMTLEYNYQLGNSFLTLELYNNDQVGNSDSNKFLTWTP